ncbi:MAG: hypothetical protein AMXMBFR12_09910 [Candidatus Babeliales bacterium]
MYQKIFISQNDQSLYPDFTCGIASLLMLLQYINFKTLPSFEKLAQETGLTISPKEKGYDEDDQAVGLYPEDIFKYCVTNNLKFRISFYDDEWKDALKKAPIMVLLTGNQEEFGLKNAHWVVLVERDKDYFTYLDPWYTKASNEYVRHIWAGDFKRYYTGIACQLLP